MSGVTITEFLLARVAEDEAAARAAGNVKIWRDDLCRSWIESPHGRIEINDVGQTVPLADAWILDHLALHLPDRVLAECAAKRRIVELHQSWPVLVTQPPEFEGGLVTDPDSVAIRMSQRMKWLTEQEYRAKFGDAPPTGPVLLALVQPYADHPDFDQTWRV